ncbi:MAG: rod shape-determining protein RodA [Streptosporangiaceae bacterium]|jgi:rod shape determining protein RodA|nr:rod shape-determining protein RodA [Actinomycetota bacterium]
MTSLRGPQDLRRRSAGAQPPAAYRGLAPVRPSGLGSAPGGSRRGRAGLLRRAFGRRSLLRRLDWILLLATLALSLIGTLLIWAATEPAHTYLLKQLLNIAIGLVLMGFVSMLDYRQLRLYAPIVYGASCLGLLVVLTPLGSVVNGARSWISLPAGFQIEPSEYAKLSLIVIAAMILGELRPGETRPGARAIALTIAAAALPLILVVAEPDLGVVMLLLALLVGLIALSGIRLRWFIAMLAAGVAGITAVMQLHLLKSYQTSRITSFLHPSADPRGTGYSAAQSKIAIGSGGMTGQGLFHGQLIAGNFIPEQHTDFIFAVSGEELGFAGTIVILVLLAIVLVRALRIAAKADDQFGMLVASGIAIWFAAQSFINIGMTMGIMPVTGLPLPFVSYGGSAMFADMIAIGALQAVYRHRTVFSS